MPIATSTPQETVRSIWQFIMSPELQERLLPFKIIFIVLIVIFVVIFVYFASTTSYLDWRWIGTIRNFLFPYVRRKQKRVRQWKKIKKMAKSTFENQRKVGLIEALNFLNKALAGSTLSKLNKEDISNLDKAVEAEKVCQAVKTDPAFQLKEALSKEAIEELEKALIELEIL